MVSQSDNIPGYRGLEDIPAIIYKLKSEPSRMDQLVDRAVVFASRFSPRLFRERFIETLINHRSLVLA